MVSEGLDRVLRDVPAGRAYLEASAGAAQAAGLYARIEAGWHPVEPLGVFGFGQYTVGATPAWMAGLGARVEF